MVVSWIFADKGDGLNRVFPQVYQRNQIRASENRIKAPRANALKSFTTTAKPSTTQAGATYKSRIGIPNHLDELFAVKELNLVVLDPVLLKCIINNECVEAMATPIIQIGTFLNNMKLIRMVFDRKLEEKSWSLNVINDNTAVLTMNHWSGFEKKVVLCVLQDDPKKDYYRLAAENSTEVIERAIDKFNTTEVGGFVVPENLQRFQQWWENGRFIECNRTLADNIFKQSKNNTRIITEEHVTHFKIFWNMLMESWYRNCGMIPYTADIDVAVKIAQYNETFAEKHKKMWNYGIHRVLAKKEYGLEMTIRIPGTKKDANADIFYLYPHNSTYEWMSITYSKSSGWKRLKTMTPTVKELCTGDIDGHLFFVPCNYMESISASMGNDWQEPLEHFGYTGNGKLTYSDGSWNETLDDVIMHY
ncbi:hypothetical protein QR680_014558 [Steinernema hermaphroditum]|uniref:W02B3.4-like N-terminal domain-containing protein n=1 Tax=Steinernema hermaphroditum TaxID=289476 RepID=A0AA39M4E3_9BILA|nr:hypothetical protein QR680_014558 [Steinernema hermaphroditum]